MHPETTLAQVGFHSSREADRLNALRPFERVGYHRQQLESYINHLAQDDAVSILYKYWIGPTGDLFTLPSRSEVSNVKYQIDFAERNGLFYEGILQSARLAKSHPNKLIALYSPTGTKLFHDTPIETIDSEMLDFLQKPYTDGQLYFLYFDGEQLRNVAVSVGSDNNLWLSEISGTFDEINEIADEEQKIFTFLTQPIVVGDVEEFFSRRWRLDYLLYTNKRKKKFFLYDVLRDMRATFAGVKKVHIPYDDETLSDLLGERVTDKIIEQSYFVVLKNFMVVNNIHRLALGGGCGGDEIDLAELSRNPQALLSSISSHFRYLKQDRLPKSFSPIEEKKEDPEGYPCRNCGAIIPWEDNVHDRSTWRTHCACGEPIPGCV